MSHFTVLVIGENPEQQLQPFQENNMGDCPKEHLIFHPDEDSGVDETTGKNGYWENPNAKWDWYQLGGRWSDFFKLKNGQNGMNGSPSLLMKDFKRKRGFADAALKKDIDFEFKRNEAAKNAAKKYDLVMQEIGDLPVNKTWEEITKNKKDIDTKKAEYWAQPRCRAWRDSKAIGEELGWSQSPDEFLVSKEQYIADARNNAISTFAVVKDGKWYEKGQMGWWGMSNNDKEDSQWNKEFSSLVDSLDDNTLLSIYDCHI